MSISSFKLSLLEYSNYTSGVTSFLKNGLPGLLNRGRKSLSKRGSVVLIGAGPGDAELLTLKAYRLILSADVVMYDWLVNPDIVKMIPAKTERIFVGKKCGQHSMSQSDICDLLLEVAGQGKKVVRLKGGDPAIFARAGEECEILARHNIPFAIVPGITAASGASAFAGIPLTHRDCAQSVRFITAHLKRKEEEPDWQHLAASCHAVKPETLVFYMGLGRLELIMKRLSEHGLSKQMAVAVVDKATSAEQQVCIGNVGNIASRVAMEQFNGPSLIIIGEVVNKRHQVTAELISNEARVCYAG